MSEPALRIGMVCFPGLGGSGIIATELAAGLARRGHRVHLVFSAPSTRSLPAQDGLSVHEIAPSSYPPLEHAPYALVLASRLVEIAREERLDLVHVHYAVPHAASAYLARRALGPVAPRIVTTLHGTDVTHVGSDPAYRPITRLAVGRSDGVTVPSEFLRREAYRLLDLPADLGIEVLPNFVDTERFRPPSRRDPGRIDALFARAHGRVADPGGPVLFHVSSFRAVKRVTDLADVLHLIRRDVPARLVLVGDGPDRSSLIERARELGVSESVCLLGTRVDFVEPLSHADAFLLTSESESFGLAALEALSCGVPVVAYAVGGLQEVVSQDVGRLVAPFDVAALASAAREILTDEALRSALGRAARARAEALFHVAPAVARYEAYYRGLLAAAPREVS